MNRNRSPRQPASLRLLQIAFSRLGPLFPRTLASLAYKLWFKTHRFKRPVVENMAASSADMSTLNINGADVTVWSWGQGKPVLFIHGWSGRGTQSVHFMKPLLDHGYRLISYDAPAHGETAGKQTNMLEIAEVVLALCDRHGPFHGTITHSFGGMIMAYACTRGYKTESAVCICPPATIESILDNFQQALAIPDRVLCFMREKLYASYGNELDKRISTLNNVRTLSIPALIIHDDSDDDISWQDGKAVALAWPGAKFILSHGLGHRRILRDKDTVKAVTNFIINT